MHSVIDRFNGMGIATRRLPSMYPEHVDIKSSVSHVTGPLIHKHFLANKPMLDVNSVNTTVIKMNQCIRQIERYLSISRSVNLTLRGVFDEP